MDVRERLKMLLEGDTGLNDLNTHLSQAEAVQPAPSADGADPGAGFTKAKQDVSQSYPEGGQFPLSYIRTYVVGDIGGSRDRPLTQINQRHPRRTPKMHIDIPGLNKRKDEGGGGISDLDCDEELVTAIPVTKSFTPATTMARFPFRYIPQNDAQSVNERFYEGDQFWNRTWDLYHLSVPMAISQTPFLLIPTSQAQALLDEINSALNLNLTLTGVDKDGLVIDIDNEMLPQPMYLGRTSTHARKKKLESIVPSPLENWGPHAHLVEPPVFEDFEKKIKQSIATTKIRKSCKQAVRDARIKKWQESLGRAQAYFGLRPPLKPNDTQPSFANGQIRPIDVLKPVNWAFQDAPIFICIDLEWMDRYGSLTEVGISTLDMMDLEGVVPGDYGHMWVKKIRSRHLRVKEHRHWVNVTYITGCPGRFGFGESEIVPSAEIPKVVDAAFQPPYMVSLEGEDIPRHKNAKRNVILVGLDLHGDIIHLQKAGSQVFTSLNEPSSVIRETIDVAELYRADAEENQKRGLRALLGSLNILSFDLHNAGNDAHYTLHALVRLMLRVAGEKPWAYELNGERNVESKDERKDQQGDPESEPKAAV
ncbi:hypothetical protein DTO039G3_384 [Penicillium roqueforti]|nr:hypothetical protein DTO039G3_384 [Penicillium roqueforti]